MQTYISILRGINVSGHNQIKMADLKQLYSDLGFSNVQTYIQSGNVVFQCEGAGLKELEATISGGILKTWSFSVPVIVMQTADLQSVIDNNPFLSDETKEETFLHVTFLSDLPDPEGIARLAEVHYPGEEFVLRDKAVYLYCPNGYGNTKLNNTFFEKKLKLGATTRNWRTTKELLKIALNTGTSNRE